MLRVVFFGMGGVYSSEHLRALAASHEIVGVISAPPIGSSAVRRVMAKALRTARIKRSDPLTMQARALGVPRWQARSASHENVKRQVAEVTPDLICIAGYRWLLSEELLAIPRLGALNSHPSLLPRHRGLLPLFWIYYRDDRETGVTIHWVTAQPDGGDIVLQDGRPLARGYSVEALNRDNARTGAKLLVSAVDLVAAGSAPRQAQDEARATAAPFVKPGTPMVDYEAWDVERVWHFLAGAFPRFREPLMTVSGRRLHYRSVLGYVETPGGLRPGTAERREDEARLHCQGGFVRLGL